MSNIFRTLLAGLVRKHRRAQRESLQSAFSLVEKDGRIYLTHEGVAFMRVSFDRSASEVANLLERARGAAVELRGLDDNDKDS